MSHYSVWVFGDEVTDQLLPFEEWTPQAFTIVDIAQEMKVLEHKKVAEVIKESFKKDDPLVVLSASMLTNKDGLVSPLLVSIYEAGLSNILIADENTGEFKAVKRVLHRGKWDWFVVGGRWSGALKIKQGMEAPKRAIRYEVGTKATAESYNALPKGHIDIERMEQEYTSTEVFKKEKEDILKMRELIKDMSFTPLQEFLEKEGGDRDFPSLRNEYKEQPAVKAIMEHFPNETFKITHYERYLKIPDESLESVLRGNAWRPFAVLRNSQWYEKGEMGWFGASKDRVSLDEWDAFCRDLLKEASDDEMVTVVDCHI